MSDPVAKASDLPPSLIASARKAGDLVNAALDQLEGDGDGGCDTALEGATAPARDLAPDDSAFHAAQARMFDAAIKAMRAADRAIRQARSEDAAIHEAELRALRKESKDRVFHRKFSPEAKAVHQFFKSSPGAEKLDRLPLLLVGIDLTRIHGGDDPFPLIWA